MTEHAPTGPGPAATPRRRRWWPFGLLTLGLVLGVCAISGYAARQHPTEPAPAAPVKAADVAAPLPAKPCHAGICATPPADNPPPRVDMPAAAATRDTRPPADNPPARVDSPAARAPGSTFAVDGVVELKSGQFTPAGATDCAGTAGYGDIGLGTRITVTDAAGAVVAVGELDLALTQIGTDVGPTGGTCDLQFTVTGIPPGRGYYGVEVAHRGSVKFSEASLRGGPLNLFVA